VVAGDKEEEEDEAHVVQEGKRGRGDWRCAHALGVKQEDDRGSSSWRRGIGLLIRCKRIYNF
jgi:hypothetical protein